jgi:hypothetical protein
MNKRVEAVLEAARKLSPGEQREVAERIMQECSSTKLSKAEEAWLRVGEERWAAYKRGEEAAYDADEVFAELRGKLRVRRSRKGTAK